MVRSKKERDSLPEHFKSIEEAAEFWDGHDLGDYWDFTREAKFEADIQRRIFMTALEPELAKKLSDCARKQGVSTETLINVWLSEKLAESTQPKP
jgi:predicted HicB family RNase H-like nuclease